MMLKLSKSQLRVREGRFVAQQMSNVHDGLAKLGAKYNEIPDSLRKR